MKKAFVLTTAVLLLLVAVSGCASYISHTIHAPVQTSEPYDDNILYCELAAENSLASDSNALYHTADSPTPSSNDTYYMPAPPTVSACWLPLEWALAEFTTDVVIVQYVASRPFGQNLTELEFVVLERLLGNAADRIFVYGEFASAFDDRRVATSAHIPGLGITFCHETNYLLPLRKISSPHANTRDDGFAFINYAVFDLDNPSNSVQLGRLLSHSSTYLSFDDISRQEIISFVAELTRDNPPAREFIRSDVIEDIITGSPYILVVEINRPLRLSTEQRTTDWGATDLYYVTAIQTLKGDFISPDGFLIIFPADAVLPGERHIVAIEPIEEGSSWYHFTSRNSLFAVEQLEYIMQILSRN